MKSIALLFTILALSAPLTANAADWVVSEQLASNTLVTADSGNNTVHACSCQSKATDSDPYVIRG